MIDKKYPDIPKDMIASAIKKDFEKKSENVSQPISEHPKVKEN